MSPPLVLIQQRCVDLPVQTGLDPLHMTARIQETLIAVTIASVDVHTNATISESPIATPLHTEGDPVLGSRLLPGIWTSPASPLRLTISHLRGASPHGGPRRLRRGASPHCAPSRLLRSALHHGGHRRPLRRASPHGGPRRLLRGALPHGGPRRLLRGASPHGSPRRLLRGASPHGGPRRLLRGTSPHGGPRRLLKGSSPPRGHHRLSEWDSLQSQDLALPGDPFIGIFALQDAPPGTSSLHREVPLRPNEDAMRRETLSPLNSSTHFKLRLKSSIEAYMQDPLITIRVVIFASWRKNVLVQSLLLRANTLALVFMWIMAPISAILQGLDD